MFRDDQPDAPLDITSRALDRTLPWGLTLVLQQCNFFRKLALKCKWSAHVYHSVALSTLFLVFKVIFLSKCWFNSFIYLNAISKQLLHQIFTFFRTLNSWELFEIYQVFHLPSLLKHKLIESVPLLKKNPQELPLSCLMHFKWHSTAHSFETLGFVLGSTLLILYWFSTYTWTEIATRSIIVTKFNTNKKQKTKTEKEHCSKLCFFRMSLLKNAGKGSKYWRR